MAEAWCNTVTNSTLNRDTTPPLGEIRNAIGWDPCNGEYWYRLALELREIRKSEILKPDWKPEDQQKLHMEIIKALEQTIRLNPFPAKYHTLLGWEYTKMKQNAPYYENALPAADLSMERAAYFAGQKDPRLHVEMGNYWVMRSKTIYPIDPRWEAVFARACWHYKKARRLEKTKDLRDEIENFVWRFYPDKELVRLVFFSEAAH